MKTLNPKPWLIQQFTSLFVSHLLISTGTALRFPERFQGSVPALVATRTNAEWLPVILPRKLSGSIWRTIRILALSPTNGTPALSQGVLASPPADYAPTGLPSQVHFRA